MLEDYMGRKASIQTGDSHDKLTVIDIIPTNQSGKHSRLKVRCECGVIKEMQTPIYNKSKSCGCSRYTDVKRVIRPATETAAFNSLYYQYKRSANKRGYVFELTVEDFRDLTTQPCYYCGIEPHRTFKNHRSEYKYNGIDRLDNTVGYVRHNCRTACFTCNQAKHSMTTEEFEAWLERIFQYKRKVNITFPLSFK